MHNKDIPKAEVFIASGERPSWFDIGLRMSRYQGKRKIATRVPPRRCNATQTSHPPDSTYEHTICAKRVGVVRDLQISPWQANRGLGVVARMSQRSR
jgi:hypothetical protein